MQVHVLLSVIMLTEDFGNLLYFVGWVIGIRDMCLQDKISTPCVKALAHDVTLEFLLLG